MVLSWQTYDVISTSIRRCINFERTSCVYIDFVCLQLKLLAMLHFNKRESILQNWDIFRFRTIIRLLKKSLFEIFRKSMVNFLDFFSQKGLVCSESFMKSGNHAVVLRQIGLPQRAILRKLFCIFKPNLTHEYDARWKFYSSSSELIFHVCTFQISSYFGGGCFSKTATGTGI